MIVERHVVMSGGSVMATQTVTKDRPDEIVDIEWPEWIWDGLRSGGWTVEVHTVESDLTPYRIGPTPPNWAAIARELAVALGGIIAVARQALADPERQPPQEVKDGTIPDREGSIPTAIERLRSEVDEARAASDNFRTARMEAEMIEHQHDRSTADGVCRICASASDPGRASS